MACFHPLTAWQSKSALNVSGQLIFKRPAKAGAFYELQVPCGQCLGCRLEKSRQWAIRCLHEAQMHDFSSFVTLTYSDEELPADGSLNYRDYWLFMRRLRRRYPKVRFYMCGEYGESTFRPHYHACLFGVHFGDRVPYRDSGSGFRLYRSDLLDRLWEKGLCSIGDVTFESAAYVARYVTKKVTGKVASAHYERFSPVTGEIVNVKPEFANMSRNPGIGAPWLAKYGAEVFPRDFCIVNGMKVKPPRYYDNLFSLADAESADYVKFLRGERAMEFTEEFSSDRLRVREVCTRARLSFKFRSLE